MRTPPGRAPRIGFVAGALGGGGVERWLAALIARTSETCEWVGVGCEELVTETAQRMLKRGVVVGPDACLELAKNCDVLLVNYSSQLDRYRRESNARLAATCHFGPADWAFEIAGRMDWDLFDGIHACSTRCLPSIPPRHRSRTQVIPNAVDPAWVLPTLSPEEFLELHDVPQHRHLFACVGRLSAEKRWELALRGAATARDAHVLVAGRFHVRLTMEEARAKVSSVAENATFVGWSDAVGDVLQCATAAVHCLSEAEAFGYGILEAAAAGVPVVATPFGIVADDPRLATVVLQESPSEADVGRACEQVAAGGEGIRERSRIARRVALTEYGVEPWAERCRQFLTGVLNVDRSVLHRGEIP